MLGCALANAALDTENFMSLIKIETIRHNLDLPVFMMPYVQRKLFSYTIQHNDF